MKNRFSKVSRGKSWILILLAVSGVASSCKDEYLLDDEKPTWLGSSIYDKLQQSGQYSNYIRLLGDPDVNNAEDADNNRGWIDVLSKTGSKTVFVANDEAWNRFFQENATLDKSDPWSGATSYQNLSAAQKKLLIHSSMLNNAIVMENLSSNGAGTSSRGMVLRHYTDIETTDTITHMEGDDLPVNYNIGNNEKDYWSRFRTENGGKGLYLVTDSTPSMMVHFTNEYLSRNQISNEDFKVFANQERATRDVHINGHRLLEQDAVCQNGYLNTTAGVMKPLASMAEVLRTNGQTRIFSHMLDRWSAPFYSATITRAYQDIMAAKGITWEDSIFVKRYFSKRSFEGKILNKDPEGQEFRDKGGVAPLLKFDPAWNAFYPDPHGNPADPEGKMATIFAPIDDVLWDFFSPNGGGWQLILTYGDKDVTYSPAHTEEDYLKLFQNIDQIPRATLYKLLEVIMFEDFAACVPSKMTQLRDDANEQLFYEDDIQHIVKTLQASNGVIYLTDQVYGPADYTSVTAPAFMSKDLEIAKWAIYYGENPKDNTYFKNFNYYAYLKAMKSRFALFLPTDDALKYLYDPISFGSTDNSRVLQLAKRSSGAVPFTKEARKYNTETGEITARIRSTITDQEICNRLKDILETHTIVLDDPLEEIDTDVNEYYISKSGSPVHVTRENGQITKVQGGFQMINEQNNLTNIQPGVVDNQVTDYYKLKNGRTYILDSPMIPTWHSVYATFNDKSEGEETGYEEFYALCQPRPEIIQACGLVKENDTEAVKALEEKKYTIFSAKSSDGNFAVDYNVTFFNNYRYTVFVPTNEAIRKAINEYNLPTWESIQTYYDNCEREVEGAADLKFSSDSLKLQLMITCLTNFIRYHFVDNSVFVDNSDIPEEERVTASYDKDKGLFNKLNIQRHNRQLQVKDKQGGEWLNVVDDEGKYNVFARDVYCDKAINGEKITDQKIVTSSSAVLHQISGVLNHYDFEGGEIDYSKIWNSPSTGRRYLKRYAIK